MPQPTTIHWHGLAIPSTQDGNPMDAILPGQEKDYNFSITNGQSGTFWYHPHPHQNTSEQVFRGLAGALIIRDPLDPIPGEIKEKILIITDLKLTPERVIPPNSMEDLMDGREGNHTLVNGQLEPKITIDIGEVQRWRIINATNARYLKLALNNHNFTLIGTDGGLISEPQINFKDILLAPAERVEVLIYANDFSVGKPFLLQALPYSRGKMMSKEQSKPLTIASLEYSKKQNVFKWKIPETLREIIALKVPVVKRKLILTENIQNDMSFLINDKKFDMDRVDFISKVGDIEQWDIFNNTDMDHPFHIHGSSFQIIGWEKNKKITKLPYLAWKDTVNIRAGEIARILIRQEFKGKRMYHCHILEHEDLGMMGVLQVE